MRGKCRAFLLVGVTGHGGQKFPIIATGPGVIHNLNSILPAPSSHRTAKVSTYRKLGQVSFTISITFFMPPHRIALQKESARAAPKSLDTSRFTKLLFQISTLGFSFRHLGLMRTPIM